MANKKFSIITDSDIEKRIAKGGEITTYKDGELKSKGFSPQVGGLYDPKIFGMKYRCECGKVSIKEDEEGQTCTHCGVEVRDKKNLYKKLGFIRLAIPVIYAYKESSLLEFMRSINKVVKSINKSNGDLEYKLFATSSDGTRHSNTVQKLWNTEFMFDLELGDGLTPNAIHNKSKKEARIYTQEVTEESEFSRCGVYGLLQLAEYSLLDDDSMNLKKQIELLVNKLIIVTNPIMREYTMFNKGESKNIQWAMATACYRSVLYFNEKGRLEGWFRRTKEPVTNKTVVAFWYNMLVQKCLSEASPILRPSKEALTRNLFSMRVGSSGRSNIVSDIDLDIETIKLPRSLAYHALQANIISEIMGLSENDKKISRYRAIELYKKNDPPDPRVTEIFETLVENSGAIFVRNPSLHRYNVMGFKVELTDDIVIHIPHIVTKAFNADFDGDQMMFILETRPSLVDKIRNDLSPKNLWFYEKNLEPVFVPNSEILYGLSLATKVTPSNKKKKTVKTFEELETLYKENAIEFDDIVIYKKNETTYGREKISSILGIPLENVIGDSDINTTNIAKIIGGIYAKENRTQILKELQKFASEIVTNVGVPSLSLANMFKNEKDNEIRKILNSKEEEGVKINELNKRFIENVQKQVKKLPDTNLVDMIKSSGRIKMTQINELFKGTVIRTDNGLYVENDSLVMGKSEASLITHALDNRKILEIKQDNVPISGYNSRQLSMACINIRFSSKRASKSNGLLLPKYLCEGRTDMKGNILPASSSTDRILVKSCIDTEGDIVYADEINEKMQLVDGSNVGLNFATGLTEAMTQSALGLKHGGKITNYNFNEITIDNPVTLKEQYPYFIELTDGNKVYKYPLTEKTQINRKLLNNQTVMKGEKVLYNIEKEYVDATLSKFSTLIGLKSSKLKHKVLGQVISCAPADGIIRYIPHESKIIIGGIDIPFENELYYYPDGYKVEAGQIICTGLLDAVKFHEIVKHDHNVSFSAFYNTYQMLSGGKFITPELVELVFKMISGYGFNVNDSIVKSNDTIKHLFYEDTKKALSNLVKRQINDVSKKIEDISPLLSMVFRGW